MSQPLLPQGSNCDNVPKVDEAQPPKSRIWSKVFRRWNVSYRLLDGPESTTTSKKPKSNWLLVLSGRGSPDTPEGEEWIQGGRICTIGASVIVCLNIILFIVAVVMGTTQTQGNRDYASMPIYRGNCSISRGWATGLHLFINIVSTGLLGASNFVMQCLGAPSREDITRAHRRRKWLDIGTYSIRNFAWMDNKRKLLWVILLLTSLPIHLLYNSAVYNSISTYAYGIVIIPADLARDESLVDDGFTSSVMRDWLGYSVTDFQTELFNDTFHYLDAQECIEKYAVELNTDLSTLALIADRKQFDKSSILRTAAGRVPWQQDITYDGYMYLCDYRYSYYPDTKVDCSREVLLEHAANHTWAVSGQTWNSSNLVFRSPVLDQAILGFFSCDEEWFYERSYPLITEIRKQLCLYIAVENPTPDEVLTYLITPSNWKSTLAAEAATFYIDPSSLLSQADHIPINGCKSKSIDEETCQLNFSWPIGLIVLICNSTKVICMYLATRKKRKNILLTVGDAISTFLADSDTTTQGRCMKTRASIDNSWVHDRDNSDRSIQLRELRDKGRTTPPSDKFLSSRMSYPEMLPASRRWWSAVGWKRWTIVVSLFLICLAVTIFLLLLSMSNSWWTKGLGKPSSNAMINLPTTDVVRLSLLSNTPQIVLSMIYYVYNSALTCMVVGAEYTSFALKRKPLRVSWPRGKQRSTYYLSLPYRYSIPFMVVSTIMHWLVSQSIFLVQVQEYDKRGDLVGLTTGCGYSNIPILVTAILGSVATALLLCLGFRPYKSQMPLAGHCSAAISAACHPPADDVDAAFKPVMWGEVSPPALSSSSSCSLSRSSSPSSSFSLPAARNNPGGLENEIEYAHCTFTSQEVSTPVDIRLYA